MKRFLIILGFLISIVNSPLSAETFLVHNYSELLNTLNNYVTAGDTILLANGNYNINGFLQVYDENITIRSQSGIRDSVILDGNNSFDGIFIAANGAIVKDITIQNTYDHCIHLSSRIDNLQIINCKLLDSGEHFIKINRGTFPSPSENGIVEDCHFEYTAGVAPQSYTGGIDCLFCKDWIVKNNEFISIKSPEPNQFADYAIHFWDESENALVEKNLIVNCDRGIGFGLASLINTGGIIRNNMICNFNSEGDVGISLQHSPYTQVYNNSIFFDHNYYAAIEYRFPETQDVYIANNLTNKIIWGRDGATGTVEYNVTNAIPDWFIDPSHGDLHLSSDTLSLVVDQGTSIPGLDDDFDGDTRPQGAGIDIGADEFLIANSIEENENIKIPKDFLLWQNYPNPFNPITTVKYSLPFAEVVQIKIYDVLGNEIAALVNEFKQAGTYEIEFIASDLPSGIYFYKIISGNFSDTKKMILLR
jgi:hypothetical protein